MNEKLDEEATTNYTTATMSDGAHAAFVPDSEETAADLSNMDALDTAEDQVRIGGRDTPGHTLPNTKHAFQDDFQEDDQVWNGAESPSSDEANARKDDGKPPEE